MSLLHGLPALAVALAAFAAAAEPTSRTVRVGQGGRMEATLVTPDGPGPFPSVLVIHTSQGLTEADRQYCVRLAREGFQCLVPAFLRAHGIRQETKEAAFTTEREAILADFRASIAWMDALPNARRGAVGAVGFSNGGLFALLLAAQQSVRAGASYYGALWGVGQPLAANPFQQSFSSRSAPVLVMMGENDTAVGVAPVRRLEAILTAAGAPHEIRIYPDAEHGFDRNNLRPGHLAAAADAWTRTLALLRAQLR